MVVMVSDLSNRVDNYNNMSLAVVIVSCDKNAWLWSAWYHYFSKNFGFDYPVYLISETVECDLKGVESICINIPTINRWTEKLCLAIECIPEQHLFIMMDDFFIKRPIEFKDYYDTFRTTGCDSLRIMPGPNNLCRESPTDLAGDYQELREDSAYKISFSPNIWKRSFLKKCIAVNESPWTCEVHGSLRIRNAYLLSAVEDDWYVGVIRKGKLIPEGKQLIETI